jgi:hypothetical protein
VSRAYSREGAVSVQREYAVGWAGDELRGDWVAVGIVAVELADQLAVVQHAEASNKRLYAQRVFQGIFAGPSQVKFILPKVLV